jgi:glycosyltransferase involved in cell wall biosynthesis
MVTHSFPFGLNENWKKNDLEILRQMYDRVYVFPINYYNQTEKALKLSQNIIVLPPINYPNQKDYLIKKIVNRIPQNKAQVTELLRMLKSFDLKLVKRCLQSISLQNKMMYVFQGELKDKLSQCSLYYFFWGNEGAESLTSKKFFRDKKIIVGFHNVELYSDRHYRKYIPFQKHIVENATILAPATADGIKELSKNYKNIEKKCIVKRIGVEKFDRPPFHPGEKLRILTISNLGAVKRINLMVEILSHLKIPFHWTHIGAEITEELEENIRRKQIVRKNIEFVGLKSPEQVINILKTHDFDVLCNTSTFEGVPVSIMEAMMAGIPIFATDVGGVSEIVSSEVGYLFEANFYPEDFAARLKNLHQSKLEDKIALRDRSRNLATSNLVGLENSKKFFKESYSEK